MGNSVFVQPPPSRPSICIKGRTNKLRSKKAVNKKVISFISSTTKPNYFDTDDSKLFNSIAVTDYERKEMAPACVFEGYCEDSKQARSQTSSEKGNDSSVVLTSSTFLYGLDCKWQHLPLGTILNTLFYYENWLYVRTAHGQEGYVASNICLPLGTSSGPTNNEADFELESLRLIYKAEFNESINYSELNVDILYLQASGIRRRKQIPWKFEDGKKTIKLIVKNDFAGTKKGTLRVKKGNIVFLLHNRVTGWFWVRNEEGCQGFIPAAIAGYIISDREFI